MRRISDTISRLQASVPLPKFGGLPGMAAPAAGRLTALPSVGTNPGALTGWVHVPGDATDMPLVVVLHGCTQSAAGYDAGSGWSALAERHGFAVLFPEQQRGNNPNLCFNWFTSEDTVRDGGEALSIRQMIAAMVERYAIDPARVFVTGLSAGGGMAAVMLATYPEVFAGGAIIAGLPYGSAGSIPQAFDRMRGHGHADAAAAAARVRAASSHSGRWPTISVWQGSADTTVAAVNADAIVAQWQPLHGTATQPDREDMVDGHAHRVWLDAAGRPAIEEYRIAGMGHGTPLATTGDDACGTAAPYMLDVGISSTRHIARNWGLLGPRTAVAEPAIKPRVAKLQPVPDPTPAPQGVQAIIESALRTAGLMR